MNKNTLFVLSLFVFSVAIAICVAPVYVAYRGVKAIAQDINSGYHRVKSAVGFASKA